MLSSFPASNISGTMTGQTATRFEACRPRISREKPLHSTSCRRIRSLSCAGDFRIDGEAPRALPVCWLPRCFTGFHKAYLEIERLRKFYDTAQPGVEILITERFAKSRKSWLPSTMAGRHPINFPSIVQCHRDTPNVRVRSCYQMESAEDKMNMLVHCH